MTDHIGNIRNRFELSAKPDERDFVNQVQNVNDVIADAVREMIVYGLDVKGVKARFAKLMEF